MRIFIVILLLVAVAFGAVVIYGVRHKEPDGNSGSKGSTPQARDGELDEDDLEGWEPPELGPLESLSSRFGPKLKLNPARVKLSANETVKVTVDSENEKVRVAQITIESGRLVQVTARHNGDEDDDVTCLCAPNEAPLAIGSFQGCPPRWVAKQRTKCEEKAGRASLPFGPEGGSIILRAPTPVTIGTR